MCVDALEPYSQVAWSYHKSNCLYRGKKQASIESQGVREEVVAVSGNTERNQKGERRNNNHKLSNQVVLVSKYSMFKKENKEVLMEVWPSQH